MKTLSARSGFGTLALGVLIGASAMLLSGAAQQTGTSRELKADTTFEDVYFPRRAAAKKLLEEDLIFAPGEVKIEDLGQLGDQQNEDLLRYEAIPLGAAGRDFMLLDRKTGLVRLYSGETSEFRLYNPRVPNQVLVSRLHFRSVQ